MTCRAAYLVIDLGVPVTDGHLQGLAACRFLEDASARDKPVDTRRRRPPQIALGYSVPMGQLLGLPGCTRSPARGAGSGRWWSLSPSDAVLIGPCWDGSPKVASIAPKPKDQPHLGRFHSFRNYCTNQTLHPLLQPAPDLAMLRVLDAFAFASLIP